MFVRFAVACLILSGATVAEAGRRAGPASKVFTVQGFRVLTVKVKFTPGQTASVSVVGDGDSPLALIVLDANGKRAAADTKNTDRFSVRWTADGDEPYRIKVYNRGGVPVRFSLKTN